MSSSNKLIDLALDAFAGTVTDTEPTPAGGSVSAAVGAFGASLVSMAFRLAAGTGEIPAYMEGRADELDDLRDLLLELVDRDATAYRALMNVGDASGEKAAKARREAFEAPMETAEFSLAALRLLAVGATEVPERLGSDCAVARHALVAAIEGGLAIAEVNLAAWPDAGERDDHTATIGTIRAEGVRLAAELATGANA